MLENNFETPDQTCVQEPTNNLIEEAWTRPATDKARCPVPPLKEYLRDEVTMEFKKELREAIATGDFGSEFREAAKKIAEKCKGNPIYEALLESDLGALIHVTDNGITFDSQPDYSHFPSRPSYSLHVPFDGEAKGYMSNIIMGNDVGRETSPQDAARRIFNSRPEFPFPNPNPFPIY